MYTVLLLNQEDTRHRRQCPTGVLVVHQQTKNVVAVACTAHSFLLLRHFLYGIEYRGVGDNQLPVKKTATGKELDKFIEIGRLKFPCAKLKFSCDTIKTVLPPEVYVTEDLRLSSVPSFETLVLTGKIHDAGTSKSCK